MTLLFTLYYSNKENQPNSSSKGYFKESIFQELSSKNPRSSSSSLLSAKPVAKHGSNSSASLDTIEEEETSPIVRRILAASDSYSKRLPFPSSQVACKWHDGILLQFCINCGRINSFVRSFTHHGTLIHSLPQEQREWSLSSPSSLWWIPTIFPVSPIKWKWTKGPSFYFYCQYYKSVHCSKAATNGSNATTKASKNGVKTGANATNGTTNGVKTTNGSKSLWMPMRMIPRLPNHRHSDLTVRCFHWIRMSLYYQSKNIEHSVCLFFAAFRCFVCRGIASCLCSVCQPFRYQYQCSYNPRFDWFLGKF